MPVHRVVAWLLVGTLAATSAVAAALHVHAYHEHDHPEHHHGPAVHAHEPDHGHERRAGHDRRIPTRPDDRRPRLAPCDPAAHAVSIAVACAPATPVHAADAAVAPVAPPVRLRRPGAVVRHADVRVHGPPLTARAAPRAPPPIAPA